jgi:hypothetical protein
VAERTVDNRHEVSAAQGEERFAKVPASKLGKVALCPCLRNDIELVKLSGAEAGMVKSAEIIERLRELYGRVLSGLMLLATSAMTRSLML